MSVQKFFTSDGVPASTPSNVTDLNLDITNDDLYYSVDTTGSGDWKKVPQGVTDLTIDGAIITGNYRTKYIDASEMIARTTSGAASGSEEATTNKQMNSYFDFDAASDEFVQYVFNMPDEYDGGTFKCKFYWKDAATPGSGDVVWGIQAVAVSNDGAIDSSFGTAKTVTDTYIASGDVHITSATSAVTIAGNPALADLTYFQIYRDADNGSDTYTQDARLLGVAIQYKETTTAPVIW